MIVVLLWIWIAAAQIDTMLEAVVGRRTRIRPTHSAYLSMAYDHNIGTFVLTRDLTSIYTEIKINRDANQYILSSNGKWLCVKKKELHKCKNATQFDIEPDILGFRIKHGKSCLTAGEKYTFKKCGKQGTEQVFVFEVDKKLICDEMRTYNPDDEAFAPFRKDVDLKVADKKNFDKAMKVLRNVSPKARKGVEKLWKMRKYTWPKWGIC